MRIGTAVPNEEEELASASIILFKINPFLKITLLEISEKEAIAKLDDLFQKNNIQIMVGGSGLYVDAAL